MTRWALRFRGVWVESSESAESSSESWVVPFDGISACSTTVVPRNVGSSSSRTKSSKAAAEKVNSFRCFMRMSVRNRYFRGFRSTLPRRPRTRSQLGRFPPHDPYCRVGCKLPSGQAVETERHQGVRNGHLPRTLRERVLHALPPSAGTDSEQFRGQKHPRLAK